MADFAQKLGEYLDLGNAEQLKAFDDFVSASSDSQRLSKLMPLVIHLLDDRSGTRPSDDIALTMLQKCVTTFTAFAAGADPFHFDSEDPARQQFLRDEVKRIRSFVRKHQLEVPLKEPLQACQTVRSEMEQTRDIEVLRRNFLAIYGMWELQVTVNNQLVMFATKAEQKRDQGEVIESQFNDLKEKVVQMKIAAQRVEERRVSETGQLRAQLQQKENELEELRRATSSGRQGLQQREIDDARVEELSQRVSNLQKEVSEAAKLWKENGQLRAKLHQLNRHKPGARSSRPAVIDDPMLARFSDLEAEIDALCEAIRANF
jgi:hypothetical protein